MTWDQDPRDAGGYKVRMCCGGVVVEPPASPSLKEALYCWSVLVLMNEAAGGRSANNSLSDCFFPRDIAQTNTGWPSTWYPKLHMLHRTLWKTTKGHIGPLTSVVASKSTEKASSCCEIAIYCDLAAIPEPLSSLRDHKIALEIVLSLQFCVVAARSQYRSRFATILCRRCEITISLSLSLQFCVVAARSQNIFIWTIYIYIREIL